MTFINKTTIAAFLLVFLNSISVICQSTIQPSILQAEETWGKEIIKFPVEWVPEMTLTGFEELRFAPGWSDPESDRFWTLVMAWSVESAGPLSFEQIERNLRGYFTGLMIPNHWATDFPDPVLKLRSSETEKESKNLHGTMTLFDGFHTGKLITVQIRWEQHYCEEAKRAMVIFRFSPKTFDHPVWKELDAIKKVRNVCEN